MVLWTVSDGSLDRSFSVRLYVINTDRNPVARKRCEADLASSKAPAHPSGRPASAIRISTQKKLSEPSACPPVWTRVWEWAIGGADKACPAIWQLGVKCVRSRCLVEWPLTKPIPGNRRDAG